ncbi:MAG: hypothetical protein QNL62_06055 [Gammaproteobacteria bacterium]|nr:hypothetical protein [Gammaproteobacteria bacterium]
MAIGEEITYLETQENKGPGYLIKAQDWNKFVHAVIVIGETLVTHQATTEQQFEALNTRVENLQNNFETHRDKATAELAELRSLIQGLDGRCDVLETNVAPLNQFYKVTMETKTVNNYFAMGQAAEITATVTDLHGNPLKLPANQMPWIDFVSTWGRLKPVAGFKSRGGVADRSISVQANGSGVAMVYLRVEHSDELSEAEENGVEAALQAPVGDTGLSIASTILSKNVTPGNATVKSAFSLIRNEYERSDWGAMQSFADTYYMRIPKRSINIHNPNTISTWKDYRSIVTAFAKADADPRTPDQSRGSSSIQVSFRDWITPWICDYLQTFEPLVPQYLNTFVSGIKKTSFETSMNRLQTEVNNAVREAPVIGKQRHYSAMQRSLSQVKSQMSEPPEFMDRLSQSLNSGISMQKNLDISWHPPCGKAVVDVQEPAFEAITQTNTFVALAQDLIIQVKESVKTMDTRVTGMNDSVSLLNTRMTSTESTGQMIRTSLSSIEDKVLDIDVTKPAEIKSRMNEIQASIGGIMTEILKTPRG